MENQCATIGTQNVLVHPENTSPHKMRAVIQYFEICPTHPTVHTCPHLTFWLFPHVKDRLAAGMFLYMQDLSEAVISELRNVPHNDYHRAFTDWLRWLLLCIQYKGKYCEGVS